MNARFFYIFAVTLQLLFGLGLTAQETFVTIWGLLKDAGTGEKIPFANITVPGTAIGTVSNSDGEFILKVDKSLNAEYFEISHLSYKTAQLRIAEAIAKEEVYYLDLHPVLLKEIPVIPRDARGIVVLAFRNIRNNYSTAPNMMMGFYREHILQNREYISIAEAVLNIYKAPYSTNEYDQVKIFKGRKGKNTRKADTLLVRLQGGPNVLALLDVVKNRDLSIAFDDLDNYEFDFDMVVNIDDRQNWVINFTPAIIRDEPLYKGKIYISQGDLAITRIEFSLDLTDPDKAAGVFVRKKPSGLVFIPVYTNYLVTYQEDNGKYYLNYVRADLKFRCDWKKKLFKKNYTLVSEMAITDRSEHNISKFPHAETFRTGMIFTEKVKDFTDVEFWGEHNIIEPEKPIENAIRKISRAMDE